MIFQMHETHHNDMKSSNFKQGMSQELWYLSPVDPTFNIMLLMKNISNLPLKQQGKHNCICYSYCYS